MSSAFHPGAVLYPTLIVASAGLLGAAAYLTPSSARSALLPLSRRSALLIAAACEVAIGVYTGQFMAAPNTEIKRAADAERDGAGIHSRSLTTAVSDSEAKSRIARFAKQHSLRMTCGLAAFLLSAIELVQP